MKKFMKNNKGFTLIEMLIVMAIIAVLVLVVVPNAGDIISSVSETAEDATNRTCDTFADLSEFLPEDAIPEECR